MNYWGLKKVEQLYRMKDKEDHKEKMTKIEHEISWSVILNAL